MLISEIPNFHHQSLIYRPSTTVYNSVECLKVYIVCSFYMATPLFAGFAVAGAAMAARYGLQMMQSLGRASTRFPRAMAGGFEAEMTRKEAFQILGLREGANKDAIRTAHRRLMRLNHPDNGGSTYVATKVNEAKDMLSAAKRGSRVL